MLYKDLLFDIFRRISSGDNFALARVGDGERCIITGEKVVAQEGWENKGGVSKLGEDLLESLNHTEENYLMFASCPCCDKKSYELYKKIIPKEFHTANIFANSNYDDTKEFLSELERDIILVANENGRGKSFGKCKIIEALYLPDACVEYWQNDSKREFAKNWIKSVAKENQNVLFVFAVGPMSEPLIHEAYNANKNNQYVDFGSSIDFIIHGKNTRPYMDKNSHYAKLFCNF